ncbi:MAG: cytochrome c-type biogenesis protein CcmH [Rhizobacter sp.]|nr:cytochrome c-type biogenesis protein CcmH [Rhizobacter sp.]
MTGRVSAFVRPASAARRAVRALFALAVVVASTPVLAHEAPPEAAEPAIEARMVRITSELRCLVCQNQTIADSNAGLAVDLRQETREMLKQGKSDAEIVDYMTARYGDFVLYRPPLRATTVLLWFGPALLLLVGASALVLTLRRRSTMADDAFDADAAVDDEDDDATGAHTAGAGGRG